MGALPGSPVIRRRSGWKCAVTNSPGSVIGTPAASDTGLTTFPARSVMALPAAAILPCGAAAGAAVVFDQRGLLDDGGQHAAERRGGAREHLERRGQLLDVRERRDVQVVQHGLPGLHVLPLVEI